MIRERDAMKNQETHPMKTLTVAQVLNKKEEEESQEKANKSMMKMTIIVVMMILNSTKSQAFSRRSRRTKRKC